MNIDRHPRLRNRLVNRSLERHGVTIEQVLRDNPSGYIGKRLWSQHYTFSSDTDYQQWKDWCLVQIKRELRMETQDAEEEFRWLDMCIGLDQPYLFTRPVARELKQGTLF